MFYLINFKTYEHGTGKRALELARIIEKVKSRTRKNIAVALQPSDICLVSQKTNLKIFAQHVDFIGFGSHTGWILPEAVRDAGAKGTLISHSERELDAKTIGKIVERCQKIGLETVVCVPTPEKARKVSESNPDYIAIEPPELIGTGIPVSKAKPEIIQEARKAVPEKIPLLCGAGINNHEDAEKAEKLGAEGVLVASAIVKANDPEKALLDLVG